MQRSKVKLVFEKGTICQEKVHVRGAFLHLFGIYVAVQFYPRIKFRSLLLLYMVMCAKT